MLVLFKNVKMVYGGLVTVAYYPSSISCVVEEADGETKVFVDVRGGQEVVLAINLPIEQVVGLINQAMGAVAVPDAPEKSVVVITGKDTK